MLFNSLEFLIFFPVVFLLYWFVCNKTLKIQNLFLLAASYFFYACWDWRFVFLLAFSTLVCYISGQKIYQAKNKKHKKYWLWIGTGVSLSFLGFFKYFNFFIDSFADFLRLLGLTPHLTTLYIILPVGISFYTFHGLSYIFDIYNDKIKPTNSWIDYSLFVAFFPLLVAGPIERATHLLPQIKTTRRFEYSKAVDGMRQILWGLFKKIVIADNCAQHVNIIFENYDSYSGSTLLLGAILFTIQIYGDFSGYSDIALGTARLLGFNLLKNFNYPYFSRDIAEFWRRWHISLSSWFKDYLYIPLGGSRQGKVKNIRNTFIIFIVSGFWHGANWTFVFWGALNALYITPSILLKRNRKHLDIPSQGKLLPSIADLCNITITFSLTVFAWIFFRASSLTEAFHYIAGIFSKSLFTSPDIKVYSLLLLIGIFMLIEWVGRASNFALENIEKRLHFRLLRWTFYIILIILIFANTGKDEVFIYFQF